MTVPSGDREAGFTLLETVIVLAIAALVFSVGALSLSSLKKQMTPLSVAGQIAEMMNTARIEARREGAEQSVTIDLKTKTVVRESAERDLIIPADYSLSVVVGRETVTGSKTVQIYFLPDGTSSGGEIVISSPQGVAARVDINWLTGLSRASDGKP